MNNFLKKKPQTNPSQIKNFHQKIDDKGQFQFQISPSKYGIQQEIGLHQSNAEVQHRISLLIFT